MSQRQAKTQTGAIGGNRADDMPLYSEHLIQEVIELIKKRCTYNMIEWPQMAMEREREREREREKERYYMIKSERHQTYRHSELMNTRRDPSASQAKCRQWPLAVEHGQHSQQLDHWQLTRSETAGR